MVSIDDRLNQIIRELIGNGITLEQAVEALSRTFRPAQRNCRPFRRHEYMPVVQQLVPESEFQWNRREIINHARLADFLSVKLVPFCFDAIPTIRA